MYVSKEVSREDIGTERRGEVFRHHDEIANMLKYKSTNNYWLSIVLAG